jgi:hypothetical protein
MENFSGLGAQAVRQGVYAKLSTESHGHLCLGRTGDL